MIVGILVKFVAYTKSLSLGPRVLLAPRIAVPETGRVLCLSYSSILIELYNKRKPDLYKLEYEGDGSISLYSKTYHWFGNNNKTSTKELNKAQNDLKKEQFMDVLHKAVVGKILVSEQLTVVSTHTNITDKV